MSDYRTGNAYVALRQSEVSAVSLNAFAPASPPPAETPLLTDSTSKWDRLVVTMNIPVYDISGKEDNLT